LCISIEYNLVTCLMIMAISIKKALKNNCMDSHNTRQEMSSQGQQKYGKIDIHILHVMQASIQYG